jgi:hypothetical protein
MTKKEEEEKLKNNEKPDEDFTAEVLMLEDLGYDPKKIEKIKNHATAVKVLKYYQNKLEKEGNKKPGLKLKANMGKGTTPLPPPDQDIPIKDYKLSLNEKMDPLCAKHAYNNQYKTKSRISVVFTEDHPNGRYF